MIDSSEPDVHPAPRPPSREVDKSVLSADHTPLAPNVPNRTSSRGLEQFIAGRTLLSGDSLAWSDLFVQVYSRHQNQEPFLVPAVAEPLVVWVMSGEALVEERDLDGEWLSDISAHETELA